MQARETSARFEGKKKITRTQMHCNSRSNSYAFTSIGVENKNKTRTLVVDGVPKSEDSQHGDDDRRRRGVLAVEIARLDAASGRLGCGALGELGVERDERAQIGTLARRLQQS